MAAEPPAAAPPLKPLVSANVNGLSSNSVRYKRWALWRVLSTKRVDIALLRETNSDSDAAGQ